MQKKMKDTKAVRHFMVTKMVPDNLAFKLRPTNSRVFKTMIQAESKKIAIAKAMLYDFGDGAIDSMNCRYNAEEWDMTGEVTRAYVDQ